MSPDEYTKEARRHTMMLAETLDYIESHGPAEAIRSVLEGGQLFDEIEQLDIDCAVLRLSPRAGEKAALLTYTWDWLEGHTLEERAARISEQLLDHANKTSGSPARS